MKINKLEHLHPAELDVLSEALVVYVAQHTPCLRPPTPDEAWRIKRAEELLDDVRVAREAMAEWWREKSV